MKYCLIGKTLKHSYSKIIHNLKGLDYSLCEIPEGELKGFFDNCPYLGFNVTIPYKKQVIPFLKEISPEAKSIGAVNTVVKSNGLFYGYNTDYFGLEYTLKRKGIDLQNKCVLVLGSGGASNTAVALCKDKKAKSVNIVSRTGEVNYENCYTLCDTQVIINATPVGMYPNVYDCPIDLSKFKNLTAVIDCIYNPFNTKLITQAKSLNIPCSNGLPMLVAQALKAESIWLNTPVCDGDIEDMILKVKMQKSNLVLSGMPSCGKTTIGKKVAKILGLNFIDTDLYIKDKTGRTPKDIILQDGEKAFRDIESEIIKEISLSGGNVIALGGGSVIREENVSNVMLNGIIIYVKRDLDKLVCENRPLSKEKGVEKLFNERKEIYSKTACATVENNGDIESAVKGVIKEYESACYKRC